MKWAFLSFALVFYTSLAWGNQYSILQGLTGTDFTQISVVLPKGHSLSFRATENMSGQVIEPGQVETEARKFSDWVAVKLFFKNLDLNAEYTLELVEPDGSVAEDRQFQALDTDRPELRLAIGSCILDMLQSRSIWRALRDSQPSLLFLVGDNVYADRTSLINKKPADPKQLWDRYVDTRNRVELYFFERLIPTLATWDDHDYGKDDGDRTYRFRSEAQDTFRAFYAQESGDNLLQRGPGISFVVNLMGQRFFFMDNRSFRSEDDHWGPSQLQWFFDQLVYEATPTWLVSGSQFFGKYRGIGESFEGSHPEEFQDLMDGLKLYRSPVHFISGDRHYSEVMEIEPGLLGRTAFELTSSPLHSYIFPGNDQVGKKNPRRRAAVNAYNFLLLKLKEDGQKWNGKVKSIGSGNRVYFSYPLEFNR